MTLAVYASEELGAYGWHEKPWYLPGERRAAFLAEIERRGLGSRLDLRDARPATDEELRRFHDAGYIEWLRERCAQGEGSLDRAVEPLLDDARRLLSALRDEGGEADAARVRERVEATLVPAMTFDVYLSYLGTEGLLVADGDALRLTDASIAFLESDEPWLGGPTFARPHIETAARWVAGAAVDAVDRILAGELSRVFIPIAGFHHAFSAEARMYCLYNDPALAIATALLGVDGPVAYVDIDIHHGDGVYEGFAEEPRVVIADLHEDPSTLFPFTPESPGRGDFWGRRDARGRGDAAGTKLNVPLEPETTDDVYLACFEEAEAFLRAARPAFVVFEAGVDGLGGDPMSNQEITVDAIAEVTRRVVALAEEHAEGRLLVLAGGGYALDPSAAAWATVVDVLAG